jgi:hypothetical protein
MSSWYQKQKRLKWRHLCHLRELEATKDFARDTTRSTARWAMVTSCSPHVMRMDPEVEKRSRPGRTWPQRPGANVPAQSSVSATERATSDWLGNGEYVRALGEMRSPCWPSGDTYGYPYFGCFLRNSLLPLLLPLCIHHSNPRLAS